MRLTVNFAPAEMEALNAQAAANNISTEEFVRRLSVKSVRNAEYLAMLDKSRQEMREGHYTHFTDEELRGFIYGNQF